MDVEAVVRAFVDAINAHDVERIATLCSEDHRFVDAHGSEMSAPDMRPVWNGYFAFMPRYGIEIETLVCEGDVALLTGWAWGALDADGGRPWRRPAAWRAQVKDGRISLWQVYVDTKVVFDLMGAST